MSNNNEKQNIEAGGDKNKDNDSAVKEIKAPDKWYGVRHTQIILLFAYFAITYMMKVNLSVGIVAMTDPTVNPDHDVPTYNWKDQSVVLSSFFWGFVLPQVPAGLLAKKYGARWFLFGTMLVCCVFSVLIPLVAPFGSWAVMVCRVIQGLAQGFFLPCLYNLLGKWVPPRERSRLGSFVFSGGSFGIVTAMPLTGWISGTALGWPFAFYLYAGLGTVWSIVYYIIGSSSPAEDKYISTEEKDYIQNALGYDATKKNEPTPWKALATSLPFWAILVSHCTIDWGFWTLLSEIPTYMSHVLNFNIRSNGLLSSLPYITLWFLSFVFGHITDTVINRGWVSITTARKIANSTGMYVSACALIALSIINKREDAPEIVIALLVVAVGINAACLSGFCVNHVDLSPTHAGTMMGITNGIANLCSIFAPLFVQFVVTDEKDADQWKIVFFVSAVLYILGNTFYIFFGSAKLQPWDSYTKKEEKVKSTQQVSTVDKVEMSVKL